MGMNLGRMSGLAGGLMFAAASVSANDAWHEDLAPIADADWSTERAAHLLERAGFGGSPEDIAFNGVVGLIALLRPVLWRAVPRDVCAPGKPL